MPAWIECMTWLFISGSAYSVGLHVLIRVEIPVCSDTISLATILSVCLFFYRPSYHLQAVVTQASYNPWVMLY